jgi:hypothetical protein
LALQTVLYQILPLKQYVDAFDDNASINCLTGLLTMVEQLGCIDNLAGDKLLGGLVDCHHT